MSFLMRQSKSQNRLSCFLFCPMFRCLFLYLYIFFGSSWVLYVQLVVLNWAFNISPSSGHMKTHTYSMTSILTFQRYGEVFVDMSRVSCVNVQINLQFIHPIIIINKRPVDYYWIDISVDIF